MKGIGDGVGCETYNGREALIDLDAEDDRQAQLNVLCLSDRSC